MDYRSPNGFIEIKWSDVLLHIYLHPDDPKERAAYGIAAGIAGGAYKGCGKGPNVRDRLIHLLEEKLIELDPNDDGGEFERRSFVPTKEGERVAEIIRQHFEHLLKGKQTVGTQKT